MHALGGGLLAIKMIGVVAGGAGDGRRLRRRRALLFGSRGGDRRRAAGALWPAGIAVASVTGTDMPAAALLAAAVWLLVRDARPSGRWARRSLFGLVLGLAAYVRAVALPLALLAAPHFRARGARAGCTSLTRTAPPA